MKIKRTLIVSVLAVALLGCGKREPRHIVIMPDVSGSIDRESLEQAFKAINDLAGHLQRGDRLTIIPILSDAEAEASGRIVRFEVPMNRQAYDTDLRNFRGKLNSSLKEMKANAIVHPGAKTDILGSVVLAEQEFQLETEGVNRTLIILSDFIQEDKEFDFRTDIRLQTALTSKSLLQQIIQREVFNFSGDQVFLGALQSVEYTRLNKERRAALKIFWIDYFKLRGAKVTFAIDGLDILKEYR